AVCWLALGVRPGGKPYYAGGLMLPLLAAGVPWVLRQAGERTRRVVVAVALGAPVMGTATFTLPLAPPSSPLTAIAAGANPDSVETIGWDRLVTQVQDATAGL